MPNGKVGQAQKLEATVAQQQRQIETLTAQLKEQAETFTAQLKEQAETFTAQLKEQAAQIQKVSAQLELGKSAPQVVANKP
jgi:F0F1-type ATP synthase membrane subunit b/b'